MNRTDRVHLNRYDLETLSMPPGCLDLVVQCRLGHGLFLLDLSLRMADGHRAPSKFLAVSRALSDRETIS